MGLDIKRVGASTEELIHRYDWRDTVRYALSVGARAEDLDFLYEARGPKVLPGYASVPGTEVFYAIKSLIGGDERGIVHGGQRVRFHRPLAASGVLSTVGTISGMYDLKRLAMVHVSSQTKNQAGELVFEARWSLIYRFDGGFGGKPPPREEKVRSPERSADFQVEVPTTEEQALFYRLNGDLNPLHADPTLAQELGFERPILHGLCTFGILDRVVVQQAFGNDPSKMGHLEGQFRSPVLPGDTLIVSGWEEQERIILHVATKAKPQEAVLSQAFARQA